MALYPVNLHLAGRPAVVIGGGAVAERKVYALLDAEAAITVISPELTPGLQVLVAQGKVRHLARTYRPGDVAPFWLVLCATSQRQVNRQAAEEARQAGRLLNVADAPEEGNFSVPSQVRRGELLLTVSTGGNSPALARRLRQELAARYGPEYEILLKLLGRLREEMKERLETPAHRERFWRQALTEPVLACLRAGKIDEAEERIRHAASGIGSEP